MKTSQILFAAAANVADPDPRYSSGGEWSCNHVALAYLYTDATMVECHLALRFYQHAFGCPRDPVVAMHGVQELRGSCGGYQPFRHMLLHAAALMAQTFEGEPE